MGHWLRGLAAVFRPLGVAVILAGPAAGQNVTLSLVPVGGGMVEGGQTVTVEAFITAGAQNQPLRGVQLDFPCRAVRQAGASGTIGSESVNTASPDAVVGFSQGGSSGGVPFLFVGAFNTLNQIFCRTASSVSEGDVRSLPAGSTRYLASIQYRVSSCAAGEFRVRFEGHSNPPVDGDQTKVRDAEQDLIPFSTISAILTVPTGRCCHDSTCLGDVNQYCCLHSTGGNSWDPALTCRDGCPCEFAADCDDRNDCTIDTCLRGLCQYDLDTERCEDDDPCTLDRCNLQTGQCEYTDRGCVYGDVAPSTSDCLVNDEDLFCGLDGFALSENCSRADIFPCEGDEEITFDDFLALMESQSGHPPCDHPAVCP